MILIFNHSSAQNYGRSYFHCWIFRQWKLEHLCYKTGELYTENNLVDQVRKNAHLFKMTF